MPDSLAACLIRSLRSTAPLERAAHLIRDGVCLDLGEIAPAARPALVSALWSLVGGALLVRTATPDGADRLANDCAYFLGDLGAAIHVLRPRDEHTNALINPLDRSERLAFLDALARGVPGVYCVPQAAARQPILTRETFAEATLHLVSGREYAWEDLLARLSRLGYERVDVVGTAGEYAVRGGIVDVYPATAELPVRLEFAGDRLEEIRTFSITSQRSLHSEPEVRIVPWSEEALEPPDGLRGRLSDFAAGVPVILEDAAMIVAVERSLQAAGEATSVADADAADAEDEEADEEGRPAHSTPPPQASRAAQPANISEPDASQNGLPQAVRLQLEAQPAPAFGRNMERFIDFVRSATASGSAVAIVSPSHRRIAEVLSEHDLAPASVPRRLALPPARAAIFCADGALDGGFSLPALGLHVITDKELYGHPARRQRRRAAADGVPISLSDLKPGDYVVHAHHGIGQYAGLEHILVEDVGRDFMLLRYAGSDRLYVPVDQMHLVRKYAAADGVAPRLSKMGGSDWARTRSRVREAVEQIAAGLVELYAARELAAGHAFAPDAPWQAELEEAFPYDETPDQAAAIRAVKDDMEAPRPMDRLICGDVGYGKTEVAVRAAFKAILDRKQVALLAPTTVLAAQHFRTFSERYAPYPVRIELLSRFRSRAEQKATLRGLADGSVDLVIGTHRLLQKDVGFKNLGLVIVDEEQRFGVMHKERLKELRRSVDVLTLSATPIPRTMHMALAGVRDLSLIQTPPPNRMAIKTVVAPSSDALIERAIRQELDRGGQVYVVHNRVESIAAVAAAIGRLVPRARIAVAHGQMPIHDLERIMLAFVEGEVDVLVSTTIIENGLDIPNVNTIIVNNADRFGLAQLYQLRGRVGRAAHQAYAYFLYQPHRALSDVARARLEAIREFAHLGSGLQLAMRDLEIRGAGNLLGPQQSGFIAAVGFDTYCEILQEAVAALRGRQAVAAADESPPVIDLRISAHLPAEYVKSGAQKVSLYQRLAAARTLEEVDRLAEEVRDRFGPLPPPAAALFDLTRLRVVAAAKGVQKVALEQRCLTLDIGPRFSLSEQALPTLTALTGGDFRFTRDAIIAGLSEARGRDRLSVVRDILAAL
jgi:transcription-repair coupling factor (superfamily II helicase)